MDDSFKIMRSSFLKCKVGPLPFTYLSFSVGTNLKRLDTWKPVYHSLEKSFGGWSKCFMSLGWRVILINSIST